MRPGSSFHQCQHLHHYVPFNTVMWNTGMCFDQQSGPSLYPLGVQWVKIEELRIDACTRWKKLFPILIPCKYQWLKILRSARVNDPRKSNQEVSPNQYPWAAVSCQYPLNWSYLFGCSVDRWYWQLNRVQRLPYSCRRKRQFSSEVCGHVPGCCTRRTLAKLSLQSYGVRFMNSYIAVP